MKSNALTSHFDKHLKEIFYDFDPHQFDTKTLKSIIGLIDYTSLNGTDNKKTIEQFCNSAINIKNKENEIPDVAAVCVFPNFVSQAKEILKDHNIPVASVATGFPFGQTSMEIKITEVDYAIEEGADEIDMVISRGRFLAGDYNYVSQEISVIKDFCPNIHLKVILETGELETVENIQKASRLAMSAGADFIKTSTGKIQPAATEIACLIMLEEIKKHREKTGKKTGIKPAGGISTWESALRYYHLVDKVLGKEWLNTDYFRIGASRLVDNILDYLLK